MARSTSTRHVVKRKTGIQPFDEKKLYASIYAASLNAHMADTDAEDLAERVTKKVAAWMRTKGAVTSNQIRHEALRYLPEDVAIMYKHHLDLC